jgi:hypothetical protein
MSVVGEIGLIAVFVGWFAASVATHIWPGLSRRLGRIERLGLLPHWNFFAPHPGVHDLHLLYRDLNHDGRISGLNYVEAIAPRRWYHALWHPDKYRSKVVADVTMVLQDLARDIQDQKGDTRVLLLSTAYVMALHLVMEAPRAPGAWGRQFILARHSSFGRDPEHEVVFFGEFHPLTARAELVAAA